MRVSYNVFLRVTFLGESCCTEHVCGLFTGDIQVLFVCLGLTLLYKTRVVRSVGATWAPEAAVLHGYISFLLFGNVPVGHYPILANVTFKFGRMLNRNRFQFKVAVKYSPLPTRHPSLKQATGVMFAHQVRQVLPRIEQLSG